MAPKRMTSQPRMDFWKPIGCTPVERPAVGSDDTTKDPNKTQGGVDSQYVLHERPVIGLDDMAQDPNETQGGVDSQQCVGLDMDFGSSVRSGPETSHHNSTTRVPHILRNGKVQTIGMNYFIFYNSQLL
jgi:hypothetical protein